METRLRMVAVFETYQHLKLKYNGYFHRFDNEANEDGSTPVAVVEDKNGYVCCPYSGNIQFINPTNMLDCTFTNDGDMIFCNDGSFVNIQESDHVGFGSNKVEAYENYCKTFYKII